MSSRPVTPRCPAPAAVEPGPPAPAGRTEPTPAALADRPTVTISHAALPPVRHDGARTVHGTAVRWLDRGILLLGPSGSGKSDLALRLIEAGARLVADDLVALAAEDGRLVARAHGEPGLLELRQQGIFRLPALASAAIGCVVRLAPASAAAERLPPPAALELLGLALPVHDLDPAPASAVPRLRLLLEGERVH